LLLAAAEVGKVRTPPVVGVALVAALVGKIIYLSAPDQVIL
jgi:hypothetical protein